MPGIVVASRVPNSPYLNQDFYVVVGTGGATFTGAFVSVGSVVSPVYTSAGSYIASFQAGIVPPGTYSVYAYLVKGSTGSFSNDTSITIQDSAIAEPAKTLYLLLKNNLGSTFSSTLISTGWYSLTTRRPQITVTRASRTDESANLFDTFREHEEVVNVDTWLLARSSGSAVFGYTSAKNALAVLDDEVKRIINSQRKDPSSKIRHIQIVRSQPLDEITDSRRLFRTRHAVRMLWDETIG